MSTTGTKKLVTAVATAGLVVALAACGDSGDGSSGAAPPSGGVKGKNVVLLAGSNTNPWAGHFNKVFTDAITGAGGKVDQKLTADAAEQVQFFNQAISQHPDLIVIEILDTTATVASIKKAAAAKVPVLAFDGPPDPSVFDDVMTVESDNKGLGRIAAENLVQGMQAAGMKSGNYVTLSGMKSMILTQHRLDAFDAYMKGHPQYKQLELVDTQWSPETATTQATQLFAKYGDQLNAVYGMADYLALPAIQAATQAGRTPGKDVVVVGGNCFKAGIDAIKAGTYFATATEDPDTLAKQTSAYVLDYFAGKKPEQHTLVKEEQITKDNVATYEEQCSHA
ncbi:MAG TPA: sugar ABC transporter substrate-binding protein [Umezawaea sp.]|nr:sugar ABC transporter substrate-binding protein [Umezawaea sp.]